VRSGRHGNVANHANRHASQHHGPGANPGREAPAADAKRGGPRRVSADIANRSSGIGGGGLGFREACQACAGLLQLRRWLRDELQDGQLALERVQLDRLAGTVVNVQKLLQLQVLPRVQGGRHPDALGSRRNLMVLQQPGDQIRLGEVTRNRIKS